MNISRSAFSLLLVGAVVLAACGDDDASVADDTSGNVTAPERDGAAAADNPNTDVSDATDGSWILMSGTVDGAPLGLIDGRDVTLTIGWGELGGTAACNGYGGFVRVGAGTFAVSELAWTEMGCEQAVMELEQAYLGALSAVTSFAVTDSVLTLIGPSSELVFELLAPIPTSEIVGTTE